MTLQQLQYVVALDTHRHFVRAAESCFVAQPTLTLQVKKLESQISLVLFDRSSTPLKPTPMGTLFIAKARHILREIEELKTLVNQEKEQMEGQFRIGVIPTVAPYLLGLFINDFIQKHPDTQLTIQEMQSEDIIQSIKKDQLDIGIMATPVEERDIREIPLYYEPFMVYADPNHEILKKSKVTPKDLRPDDLWLLGQGHCFRNHTLNLCEIKQDDTSKSLKMEAGSIETLKNLIQKVHGYTLIPELSYDIKREENHCIRFTDPQPVREISLVVHRTFTKEKLITELRKSIIRHTPKAYKKNHRFVTVEWR